MSKLMRQPTLYIPHGGGPCFFMDWPSGGNKWLGMQRFLESLACELPAKPNAILVISGHWEETIFTVNGATDHKLYYDYYGFPPDTYQLTYPVKGSSILATAVIKLLKAADIPVQEDNYRGLDHGVFIPFKVIYPKADIPIVQLSLKKGLSPQEHLLMGKALISLRDQGVLIVGSGMSYHNLSLWGGDLGSKASSEFDNWLTTTLLNADVVLRNNALCDWSEAPYARLAHPREEHLLPLMVAVGAGGLDRGQCIYSGKVAELTFSAYRFG